LNLYSPKFLRVPYQGGIRYQSGILKLAGRSSRGKKERKTVDNKNSFLVDKVLSGLQAGDLDGYRGLERKKVGGGD